MSCLLRIGIVLEVQYIMHGKTEDTKASLISEAVNVLSNMSELQIQQCLAMMKALKNVQITD